MEQWYWYQPLAEGTVRLLRVFGKDSQVILPRAIAAGRVTEIADYCFAEKERKLEHRICSDREEFGEISPEREGLCQRGGISAQDSSGQEASRRDEIFLEWCEREGMRPLSGKNVTYVELPDTLEKIGDFAFYQCRELQEISLGMGEMEVGSDAFMNCHHLSTFYFRGNPEESCCLKQILAQRSEMTSVYFAPQGVIKAALLYPEYSESYDLIGPAHIFELNIQGEGFRARQCFRDGAVDFGAYDQIFALECGEESVDTLCRMACNRLQYPLKLQDRERRLYEDYVSENIDVVCRNLVDERNLSGIQNFYEMGLIESSQLQRCLERAVNMNWTEGVRQMLSLKEHKKEEDKAYAFEDF